MNLGTRLNNWLNIRWNEKNNWKGQIGQESGFCIFDTVEHGLRAARIILQGYIRKGFNTVEKIIGRFAPSVENNTESYINFVCEQTGYVRNEILLSPNINQILRAMAKIETGNTITDQQMIEAWTD